MHGLDLFSGIGGLSIALSEWVRTVAYCENDKYAQGVLLSRMSTRQLDHAPIWDDIRTLSGLRFPNVDIIYGGFPCQDISVAGAGEGLEGKRSGLVFEVFRLIKEIEPTFVFLENVPAIRTRGGERVVKELASLGYDCRWDVISAAECGYPHIRKRWFLLAYADGMRLQQKCRETVGWINTQAGPQELGYKGREGRIAGPPERQVKPSVVGTGDGLSYNVGRSRTLGNAVVPAQARKAFKRLMGLV